jgi:hypothetical protein
MSGGGDEAGRTDWKEAYKAAMVERDSSKLSQLISDALIAVTERVHATRETPHDPERQMLSDAAQSLHLLQQLHQRRR